MNRPPPPQPKKILPEHEAKILEWIQEDNMTLATMMARLKDQFSVEISKGGLSKIVTALKQEQAQFTQAKIRTSAGAHAADDIEELKNMLQELIAMRRLHYGTKDHKVYFDVCDRQMKLTQMLLDLGGARDRAVEHEGTRAKEALIEKVKTFEPETKTDHILADALKAVS